ncbi:hypothetical protein Fmac_023109 [Flemingia macrophylla]|uniref:Uncharacterized protein n=1 Tax=Flemingia macrophylla TaxID=520843 RepID=A0ABD1LKQ6_9FABA
MVENLEFFPSNLDSPVNGPSKQPQTEFWALMKHHLPMLKKYGDMSSKVQFTSIYILYRRPRRRRLAFPLRQQENDSKMQPSSSVSNTKSIPHPFITDKRPLKKSKWE